MEKTIEPKLKKIGDYLKLAEEFYLLFPHTKDRIPGESANAISYGRIS